MILCHAPEKFVSALEACLVVRRQGPKIHALNGCQRVKKFRCSFRPVDDKDQIPSIVDEALVRHDALKSRIDFRRKPFLSLLSAAPARSGRGLRFLIVLAMPPLIMM
jgi:hypothetical protein